MKRFVMTFAALLACALAAPASAQTPLFTETSEIEILIEGPIGALVRAAPRSTEPYAATLTLTGEPQVFEIKLEARGVSRRVSGICSFPPLRLDFDRDDVGETLFAGQNRLKLVTRCRGGANYEQLTVLEYLAYRLYNEITPLSYRVRSARVTYRDSDGRRREETQFGFLIEDIDDVAARNGRVALDVLSGDVPSSGLDPEIAARAALFQYMIGNLDWDMVQAHAGDECCHNGKLIAARADARMAVVPVPYDFDFSGLVNAPYATPPPSLPVHNVRTRHFRGYCRHNDQMPSAIAHFLARRDALYALIDGESRLSASRQRSTRAYLDDFFETIENPDQVERRLIRRCR